LSNPAVVETLWLSTSPIEEAFMETSRCFFSIRTFGATTLIYLSLATIAGAKPAAWPSFSDSPTDEEFLRAGLFVQPLIPVGTTTRDENRRFASALIAYTAASRQEGRDAVQPLLSFLADNPRSAWKPILLVCLGAIYRSTGHYSKALAIWQEAWEGSRSYSDQNGRVVADSAAAYLSQFEAYLGRKETLAPLLQELRAHPARGAAAELISESASGLADMLTRPDMAFKCGPSALSRILTVNPTADVTHSRRILTQAQSTPMGLSLTAVQAVSVDAGMGFQMAFRSPGAPLIMPAVAHWKVGHYAALLGQDKSGRLLVGDTTFGEDIMLRPSTLDEEASGYFLVGPGALPEGWRNVDAAEGNTVWGRGDTGNRHDNGATGCQEVHAFPSEGGGGCSTWNVEAMVDGLSLHDDPIGYKPPVGPEIRFPMDYSHRDAQQPMTFTYINFGNKWTTEWLSYVIDDGRCAGFFGDVVAYTANGQYSAVNLRSTLPNYCATLYRRGGGTEPYLFSAPFNQNQTATTSPGQFSQATLTRNVDASGNVTSYVRNLPDGSVERFTLSMPFGGFFDYYMTEVDDPQGNAVKIAYDSLMRIVTLTDAIGQVTTLCYTDTPASSNCTTPPAATAPPSNLQVTQVTDPFRRSAYFGYDPATGHLISIKDVLGIQSTFTYAAGSDFINTLQTPYGSTTFVFTDATNDVPADPTDTSRSLMITDALGRVSRVEYRQGSNTCQDGNATTPAYDTTSAPGYPIVCAEVRAPSIPVLTAALQNEYLQFRNTFIWNPQQYTTSYNTSNRYLGARIIHWLHTDDSGTSTTTSSRIPESVKEPLDSRVWFAYPNQALNAFGTTIGTGSSNQPAFVARVLDDKTTQVWMYQYNPSGKLTQSTDPANRQLTMTYDTNGIDLLTVTNTTPIAGSNTHHSDLLLSLSSYNSHHQPQQITRANGQKTSLTYNSAGQLLSYTDPLNSTWIYTYEKNGQLQKIVGPAGSQMPKYTFTYDAFGRLGTYLGPDGRLLTYSYDSADRLTNTLFPDHTTEILGYTNLDLTTFTDRRGNQTSRKYDAQRELIEIDEPGGRTTKLSYWPNGELKKTVQDPLNSVTSYITDTEGRITAINYPDGTNQWRVYDTSGRLTSVSPSPTQPAVQYSYNIDNTIAEIQANQVTPTFFTYDPAYQRLTGWLQSVASSGSPILSQETFSYGLVGSPGANQVTQDVTSQADSTHPASGPNVTTSYYSYDQLDRLESWAVKPGAASLINPTEKWSYDAIGRVTQDSSSIMGTFVYSYSDATARVAQRTNSSGGPALTASYYPPTGDGLLQQILYKNASGAPLGQYSYTYDANHNVTSFAEAASTADYTTKYAYDTYNQLISAKQDRTAIPSKASSNLTQYSYDLSGNLSSEDSTSTFAGRPSLTNTISTKYGPANGITTSTISASGQTSTVSATYDAAGNGDLLAAGANGAYSYDAFNRLTQAGSRGGVTQFVYDGIGRLVQVIDSARTGAVETIVANHSYAWCGNVRCVETDNTQQVTPKGSTQTVGSPDKIYFAQGSAPPGGGAPSYELTDVLGSVRSVFSANAAAAEYDYDPLGNRSVVTGTASGSDRGFAGYYYHALSGLQFARNRAYNANLGRWLTRDPIGNGHAFASPARFNASDLNLYTYVRNDPTSLVDQSGLWDAFVFGSVGFEPPLPAGPSPGLELVGLAGYNSDSGLYDGYIAAGGGSIDFGVGGVSFYSGDETISGTSSGIFIGSFGIGPNLRVLGAQVDVGGWVTSSGEYGPFADVHGELLGFSISVGFGFDLSSVLKSLGCKF